LRYKKLDGVPEALAALGGGGKTGLSRSPMPKRSHHAFRFTSSNKPDTYRTWKKPARSIG